LNPWEFSVILRLSKAFCIEFANSKEADSPPPYGDPVMEFDRNQVASKIRSEFKAFMSRKKTR